MIIPAQTHDIHSDTNAHAPSLADIASLRLEMRTSFHELSERLTLLEIERMTLASRFDALLSLVNEAVSAVRR